MLVFYDNCSNDGFKQESAMDPMLKLVRDRIFP